MKSKPSIILHFFNSTILIVQFVLCIFLSYDVFENISYMQWPKVIVVGIIVVLMLIDLIIEIKRIYFSKQNNEKIRW